MPKDVCQVVVPSRSWMFSDLLWRLEVNLMMHPLSDPYWMDCIRIVRSSVESAVGRTIGEMARERSPHSILEAVYESSWEVVFDLLVEDPDTTCADFIDKREYGALKTFLAHPAGMPCTDVGILPAQPPRLEGLYTRGVSPTAYGLFPHYLRTMVREWGALSLEEAVHKATSLPADVTYPIAAAWSRAPMPIWSS